MASKNNILTDSQINSIQKEMEEIFIKENKQIIEIDLKRFQKRAQTILKYLKLQPVYHTSEKNKNKIKGYALQKQNIRNQRYAMEGYLLIMELRAYLFGSNPINYRYYYSDSEGKSHVKEFTEGELLHYVKFNALSIQINDALLKKDEAITKDSWDFYVQNYSNLFTQLNYIQQAKGGYGYVVRSGIMGKYGSNYGLWQKNRRQYQLFNLGHIYEALDKALSAAEQEGIELSNQSVIENYLFGKYLALDNIKASQGPDNPLTNTSIKSGRADLYDYSTIVSQLEDIVNILYDGYNSVGAQARIMKIFLTDLNFEKTTGTAMQDTAEIILDKLLKNLT